MSDRETAFDRGWKLIDRGLPVRRRGKAAHDGSHEGGDTEWRTLNRWSDLGKGGEKFRIQKRGEEKEKRGSFPRGQAGRGKTGGKVCSTIGKYEKNCKANKGIGFWRKFGRGCSKCWLANWAKQIFTGVSMKNLKRGLFWKYLFHRFETNLYFQYCQSIWNKYCVKNLWTFKEYNTINVMLFEYAKHLIQDRKY